MTSTAKLQTALGNYQPVNPVENTHRLHMLDLLERCGTEALYRTQFKPGHFCGSMWILNPAHSHVLLLEHTYLNMWVMPGGHADGDADLLAVAIKEMTEETGLTAADVTILQGGKVLDVDVHPIPANPKKNEPEHLHYDARYVVESKSSALPVSPEGIKLRWHTFAECEKMFPPDGGRYRCLHKLAALRT